VCNEVKDAISSGGITLRQAVIISQIKPNGAPNVPRSWDSQREFLSLLLKDEERKGKKLSDQETLQLTRISGGCWRLASFKRRARASSFCDIPGPDVQNITEPASVASCRGSEIRFFREDTVKFDGLRFDENLSR